MTTARLGLKTLTAGVSTRANLISYWNANLAILDNALTTNAAITFQAGHGADIETTNAAFGISALAANTTGAHNTAIGKSALEANTVGADVTGVGYNALAQNTTGIYNTAVGSSALTANTTGMNNTALGMAALLANTTGVQNTAVGKSAGSSVTTGTNVTCIGYNAQASAATTTDEIVLGNAGIARLRCQVTTITALSDRRDKKNIIDLPIGLAFLRTVRPVQFRWCKRPEILDENGHVIGYGPQPEELGPKDIGFISQELNDAETAASVNWLGLAFKTNDQRWESNSGKLFAVMVKAIQELAVMVEGLQAEVAALKTA